MRKRSHVGCISWIVSGVLIFFFFSFFIFRLSRLLFLFIFPFTFWCRRLTSLSALLCVLSFLCFFRWRLLTITINRIYFIVKTSKNGWLLNFKEKKYFCSWNKKYNKNDKKGFFHFNIYDKIVEKILIYGTFILFYFKMK